MDRASDYGSEGWGFESLRARSGPPRCDPPVGVLHFYQALLRECFFHVHPSVAFSAGRFPIRPETKAAQQQACLSGGATELGQHSLFRGCSAKNFAQHTINRRLWAIFRAQGELFRAQDARHGDYETNDTSATADADQCETAITNARPQTATIETTITSATEKHTNNAHFSPAKAMSVSTPHAHERAKAMTVSSEARPARAKATPVSRERFPMPTGYGAAWPGFNPTRQATYQRPGTTGVEGAGGSGGPGCGGRGRWRGLAGLRDDAPSGARGADGSRAGRRPRAHKAARPHSRALRRLEHQWGHKRPSGTGRRHDPWLGGQGTQSCNPESIRNVGGAMRPGHSQGRPDERNDVLGGPAQAS